MLEYCSVRFETEEMEQENYQGNAVVNYTGWEVPYTRIIEHQVIFSGRLGSYRYCDKVIASALELCADEL